MGKNRATFVINPPLFQAGQAPSGSGTVPTTPVGPAVPTPLAPERLGPRPHLPQVAGAEEGAEEGGRRRSGGGGGRERGGDGNPRRRREPAASRSRRGEWECGATDRRGVSRPRPSSPDAG